MTRQSYLPLLPLRKYYPFRKHFLFGKQKKNLMKEEKTKEEMHSECTRSILPVKDALEVLNGRWKLPIIIALTYGDKRFKEISKEVRGITDKVLSKELKELEMNKLISRTVHDTFPPKVVYSITDHGHSLKKVISELHDWGSNHRKVVLGI